MNRKHLLHVSMIALAFAFGASADALACHPRGPKDAMGNPIQHYSNGKPKMKYSSGWGAFGNVIGCTEPKEMKAEPRSKPDPKKSRAADTTLPLDVKQKPKQGVGFHDVEEKPAATGRGAVGFNPQPDPLLMPAGGGAIPGASPGRGTGAPGRR
jgi:hypothetical protein